MKKYFCIFTYLNVEDDGFPRTDTEILELPEVFNLKDIKDSLQSLDPNRKEIKLVTFYQV